MGPVELQFIKKHKFSWSQQMSIAFAIIWGDGHGYLIKWIVEVLERVLAAKQEIVLTTDGGINGDEDEDDENGNVRVRRFGRPSDEAISKFTQFGTFHSVRFKILLITTKE